MTTDLETRLTAHYREVADQLVLPDVTLDVVLARSSDAPVIDRLPQAARPSTARWLAIAAALLLLVGGLAAIAGRGDGSDNTLVDRPSNLLTTLDGIADDEWVIAGPLPPDVVYMYANAVGIERDRTVTYGNQRESGTFERLRIAIGRPPVGDGVTVDIAGAEWRLDPPVSGQWTASRELGSTTVTVSDSGAFDQSDRDLLAGLIVVPAERLPFPPLGDRADADAAATFEVASFELDGVVESFVVQESNGYWCTWIVTEPGGESGGCSGTIDASAAVTIEAGYSMVAGGDDTAVMVSAGTVSADSVRVEVDFGNGNVVEVTPTDSSGRFDRKFWIAGSVVPVDGRSVTARSYAADGELLGTEAG